MGSMDSTEWNSFDDELVEAQRKDQESRDSERRLRIWMALKRETKTFTFRDHKLSFEEAKDLCEKLRLWTEGYEPDGSTPTWEAYESA